MFQPSLLVLASYIPFKTFPFVFPLAGMDISWNQNIVCKGKSINFGKSLIEHLKVKGLNFISLWKGSLLGLGRKEMVSPKERSKQQVCAWLTWLLLLGPPFLFALTPKGSLFAG